MMGVRVHFRGVPSRLLRVRRTATVAQATELAWRAFHLDGSTPTPPSSGRRAGGAEPAGDGDEQPDRRRAAVGVL